MKTQPIKVLKFGGTSVGSAEALLRAVSIIRAELPAGGVVVVSALSGITEQLLKASAAAGQGDEESARSLAEAIRNRHRTLAGELGLASTLELPWKPLFERLSNLLEGMSLVWETSPRVRDSLLALGEALSAQLMTALLKQAGLPARFEDVRSVLLTDGRHGKARPRLGPIQEAAKAWRPGLDAGEIIVTQGFVGTTPEGHTTTLGRGGSDTSATLLGEALEAGEVQIWTDVDGVLTADPSLVPEARPIPEMSLQEAAALSAFGAKVLHADSLAPAQRAGFRLVVANTQRPQASRTVITREMPLQPEGCIRSVAYKEGLVCVHFPPAQDLDLLFETAAELQEAGAVRYGVLGTPEGSLLVVRPEHPEAHRRLQELGHSLRVDRGWAIVALVGEGLRSRPGEALSLMASEPVAGVFAGGAGISVAFLVPEARLAALIPELHGACFGAR